jgi:serine/threonine-protein kinase SRPK3
LSGRNVAFTSEGLSQLTEEKLFEIIGTPETEELTRRDGKPLGTGVPNQLVKATGWDNWIDEDDEDLRIFDLGEAFLKGTEPKKLPQPSHLKAPETIFGDSCGSTHDLWRAGIMVRTLC